MRKASEYVAEGYSVVVDMDLEKLLFDRVNHDVLMGRLARRIADKRLLRIVRRFLETGIAYSDDADHQFRQADHRFRSMPITL